ncbi:D-isomer specific 2-hydroxyacid dehydrogenase [Lasiosphaeria hispida]|uniref:D-isomer specific 2-hydroxyacid dehydrogenase n=1 Tax=Lasiosphaeria hispida TaxID=260671 RepID=A0AAJ0HGB8_9PEZI|nr:D-isomer specific 2-hydroxyacid dehydrogenase [Lasiosphaeria hispida]
MRTPAFHVLKSINSHLSKPQFSTNSLKMKLLYPTSLRITPSLLEAFPSVTLHPYDPRADTIPTDLLDASILVTWVNSPSNLAHAFTSMPNLRWIQSLAAGPNDVLAAGFSPAKIAITTGSGLHDRTVAEHTLGLLLNAARRFYEMRDFQLQGKWPGHLGGPQPDREPGSFRTLRDARVTVWGFGNIAKTLVPNLTALGAVVKGVARSTGVRDGYEVYAEDRLAELLPQTDALVMILPGDASTRHALNKERLALLPKHAWVVNVGRGTSIDEDALVDALEAGTLGGAALDVFEHEPLEERSRLWKAPNAIVSPHAAGGRPQGAEALIVENLTRFLADQQLRNAL